MTEVKNNPAALDRYNKRLDVALRASTPYYAVHVPVVRELPQWWAWVTDGDSFEAWGEARDGGSQHAIILTSAPWDALEALQAINPTPLDINPHMPETLIAVITDPFDWSKQYYTIHKG